MNWYKIFYWLTVADSFKTAVGVVSIVAGILMVVLTVVLLIGSAAEDVKYVDWQPITKRLYKGSAFLFFFFGLIWIITPTKTDCLLIIAGGSVGNFITSDSSSKAIPHDISKFLHMGLQKQISDLSDEAKRELGMQTPKEKLIDKVKDLSKEQLIEYLKSDTTLIH